jgi:hypothetical protein
MDASNFMEINAIGKKKKCPEFPDTFVQTL